MFPFPIFHQQHNDKRISKRTKTKSVFVVAMPEKSCLNALYEREITLFLSKVPEFIRLSIKVTEYARFQNNYFWNYNITVSFSVRILSVVVFPAICMRLYRNFRQHKLLFASMSLFQEKV